MLVVQVLDRPQTESAPSGDAGSNSTQVDNPLLSLREWLSPENIALFVVCIADLVSTLYFVHQGMAVEDNPVYRDFLSKGDGVFVGMKLLSFMPLIAVSTYYRRRRPRLIVGAMRFTVAVYVIMYVARFCAQFYGI